MWQKCPICKGTGKTENDGIKSKFLYCKNCLGKGIISDITGLPPDYTNTSTVKNSDYLKDNG